MCMAQKTLKNMPSTTTEVNQELDYMDEFIYPSKPVVVTPAITPIVHDRQQTPIPVIPENAHFEQSISVNVPGVDGHDSISNETTFSKFICARKINIIE